MPDTLLQDLLDAQATIHKLRGAIILYGQHEMTCEVLFPDNPKKAGPCDCGFAKLMEDLRK